MVSHLPLVSLMICICVATATAQDVETQRRIPEQTETESQQDVALSRDFLPLADPLIFRQGIDARESIHSDIGSLSFSYHFNAGQENLSPYFLGEIVVRLQNGSKAFNIARAELFALSGTPVAVWSGPELARNRSPLSSGGDSDFRLPLLSAGSAENLKAVRRLSIRLLPIESADRTAAGESLREVVHSLRVSLPKAAEPQADWTADRLAVAAFEWFEKYRNPESGLVPDRAPNRTFVGNGPPREFCCSIASVGYYLSLLPDAVSRGQLDESQARERALRVLGFLEAKAEHRDGLLYHFIDMKSGLQYFDCEYSALDTAILLNGCMVASVRFGGDVAEIADRLIDRVDWPKFVLPASGGRPKSLSMGWKQGPGLLGPMDVRSSEFAMPYFLAIGSKDHPVEPQLWQTVRKETGIIAGLEVMNPGHGLFTSYYGLAWHSLSFCRGIRQEDLWQNAEISARVNRAFCQMEKSTTYSRQNGNWWGISAGDSPDGYYAPGLVTGSARGTVWPTASLAAIPWAEVQLSEDLNSWQASAAWKYVCGPYGLAPFNLEKGWVAEDLIGIDVGSMAVNIINHRDGSIWKLWEQHPVAKRAIQRLSIAGN